MMEKMLSSNTELLRCCSDKRNNFCVDCSLKLTGIRVIYIKLRDDHAASNHYYIVINVKNRDANTSSTTTECTFNLAQLASVTQSICTMRIQKIHHFICQMMLQVKCIVMSVQKYASYSSLLCIYNFCHSCRGWYRMMSDYIIHCKITILTVSHPQSSLTSLRLVKYLSEQLNLFALVT